MKELINLEYTIFPTAADAPLAEPWGSPLWQRAATVELAHFHPAGSSHRPAVRAKVLYTPDALNLRFSVSDRYLVCRHTHFQESVYKDSCVEFFVQPRPDRGYFNFEINCGGTLLSYYIEDPTRTADGFVRFTKVAEEHGRQVEILHSLPQTVDPEEPGPIDWEIGCKIPRGVLEAYIGALGAWTGQVWRGTFTSAPTKARIPIGQAGPRSARNLISISPAALHRYDLHDLSRDTFPEDIMNPRHRDHRRSFNLSGSLRALAIAGLLSAGWQAPVQAEPAALVPKPAKVEWQTGVCTLDADTKIVYAGKEAEAEAETLASLLRPATGLPLAVSAAESADKPGNSISLSLDAGLETALGKEGYRLSVEPQESASSPPRRPACSTAGRPCGNFFLPQSSPTQNRPGSAGTHPVVASKTSRGSPGGATCSTIPGISSTLTTPSISWMAWRLHKLNVLHMHLSDDDGWRIEIRKYPKLTDDRRLARHAMPLAQHAARRDVHPIRRFLHPGPDPRDRGLRGPLAHQYHAGDRSARPLAGPLHGLSRDQPLDENGAPNARGRDAATSSRRRKSRTTP